MSYHLNSLPLEQKVGQLFFIGLPGPELDKPAENLLNEISPGGVCLFARNIREGEQTRKLLDKTRELLPALPFLSIDQEGGLVDRLRRIMTPMPPANSIRSPEAAERFAEVIAETLRILGFNMDFAPVVDVIDEERSRFSNGLVSRNFGNSSDETLSLAGAFLQTLQQNGCLGCLKHFPGLGGSQSDSHDELPIVDITEAELRATDLNPYKELISTGDARAIMIAHATFPGTSLQETDRNGKLLPSSLSKNIISTLLRDELGFDGLVITDDLEMGAIVKNYGVGDACTMAIDAGADMLAICADPDAIREGYQAVLDAVQKGTISEDAIDRSLQRIQTAKALLSEPLDFDTVRLKELSDEVVVLNEQAAR
jgi:beta-N-acetylhexosaminidase